MRYVSEETLRSLRDITYVILGKARVIHKNYCAGTDSYLLKVGKCEDRDFSKRLCEHKKDYLDDIEIVMMIKTDGESPHICEKALKKHLSKHFVKVHRWDRKKFSGTKETFAVDAYPEIVEFCKDRTAYANEKLLNGPPRTWVHGYFPDARDSCKKLEDPPEARRRIEEYLRRPVDIPSKPPCSRFRRDIRECAEILPIPLRAPLYSLGRMPTRQELRWLALADLFVNTPKDFLDDPAEIKECEVFFRRMGLLKPPEVQKMRWFELIRSFAKNFMQMGKGSKS